MRILENLNYDFLGKRKIAYAISITLFLIGVISVIVRGLEFGIDFKGGTEIVLQFEKPVDVGEIRTYVENLGLGTAEVKTFGGETGIMVRTEEQVIPPEIFPKVVENIEIAIEKYFPGIQRNIIDSTASSITYE
ncbi:MAG: protein translocase subunit SecF, partial [Ignavibacteriae bacterium]